jgi:hypothetical protein
MKEWSLFEPQDCTCVLPRRTLTPLNTLVPTFHRVTQCRYQYTVRPRWDCDAVHVPLPGARVHRRLTESKSSNQCILLDNRGQKPEIKQGFCSPIRSPAISNYNHLCLRC